MSGLEILGIAASVVQIAELGGSLSVRLFTFSRKIKNADRSIDSISKDIAATGSVLQQLGNELNKNESAKLCSPEAISAAKDLIEECRKVFNELNNALGDSATGTGTGGKIVIGLKQRLKFPFIQPQIDLLQATLEKLKSSLLVMLNVLIFAGQVRNQETLPVLQEQKDLLSTLVQEQAASKKQHDLILKRIEGLQDLSHEPATLEGVGHGPEDVLLANVVMDRPLAEASTGPMLKSIPLEIEAHADDILAHSKLIDTLLGEIDHVRHKLDFEIRDMTREHVLQCHWKHWVALLPEQSEGQHTIFAEFPQLARYWRTRTNEVVRRRHFRQRSRNRRAAEAGLSAARMAARIDKSRSRSRTRRILAFPAQTNDGLGLDDSPLDDIVVQHWTRTARHNRRISIGSSRSRPASANALARGRTSRLPQTERNDIVWAGQSAAEPLEASRSRSRMRYRSRSSSVSVVAVRQAERHYNARFERPKHRSRSRSRGPNLGDSEDRRLRSVMAAGVRGTAYAGLYERAKLTHCAAVEDDSAAVSNGGDVDANVAATTDSDADSDDGLFAIPIKKSSVDRPPRPTLSTAEDILFSYVSDDSDSEKIVHQPTLIKSNAKQPRPLTRTSGGISYDSDQQSPKSPASYSPGGRPQQRAFTKTPTYILEEWLLDHLDDPHPSKADIQALALGTGLTAGQIKKYITAALQPYESHESDSWLDHTEADDNDNDNDDSDNNDPQPQSNATATDAQGRTKDISSQAKPTNARRPLLSLYIPGRDTTGPSNDAVPLLKKLPPTSLSLDFAKMSIELCSVARGHDTEEDAIVGGTGGGSSEDAGVRRGGVVQGATYLPLQGTWGPGVGISALEDLEDVGIEIVRGGDEEDAGEKKRLRGKEGIVDEKGGDGEALAREEDVGEHDGDGVDVIEKLLGRWTTLEAKEVECIRELMRDMEA